MHPTRRPVVHTFEYLPVLTLFASAFACGAEGVDAPSTAQAPTYWRDVKPLLDAKCTSCHHEGGLAPFPLTSFERAQSMRVPIRYAVSTRVMPPWPAARDCRDYQNDRSLSDEEIATITAWADAGAPEGDPSTFVARSTTSGPLERDDVVLRLAEPYVPQLQPDEYRCFVLDWPLATDAYVTAYEGRPDNGRTVHHMIAYLARPDEVAHVLELDAADARPGYSCFGGAGGDTVTRPLPTLSGWTPGAGAIHLPPGVGFRVPAGSKIVLQIHYNSAGAVDADQSAVAYTIEPAVEKVARLLPFLNPSWLRERDMKIAAGDPDATHAYAADPAFLASRVLGDEFRPGEPITVWSSLLHMHTRGTSARLEIEHVGGARECLLDIRRWSFHWQGAYPFVRAATIMPGEQVHLECHWDNGPANQPVVAGERQAPHELTWGEGTEDEMCLAGMVITQ